MTQTTQEDQKLGQGRSGLVFRSRDAAGREVARKVFDSDSITKIVQYVFTGGPNPYIWNEDAIRCAVLRRRILDVLVPTWFGERLHVARAYGHGWNDEYRAWEISCELIRGRHVLLHHPYSHGQNGQLQDARHAIMKRLQQQLIEAGFDGLVWQAGRGNPVALNNLMCENPPTGDHDDDRSDYRWAWIDLESGIPAVIPINPIDLLTFYLPRSLKHGGPLFDDVDIDRLRAYVNEHRDQLGNELDDDIDELAECQLRWKSLPRHRCSIGFRFSKGELTQEQADYYSQRPVRWYAREFLRGVKTAWHRGNARITHLLARVETIDYRSVMKFCWGMLSSQDFRVRTVRALINGRIDEWLERGQLTEAHADDLRERLKGAESSRYLIDFGVHIAVKGIVKPVQWTVFPALLGMGVIDEWTFGLLIATVGAIVRTAYTLGRLVENMIKRHDLPWIALIIGALPMVGNLAFPVQIIFTSHHENAKVAQFIVYDAFSQLGRWIPIWGGADTLTEHVFNRLPDRLIESRRA